MTGIYKITSPSGKIYIGSSIDIDYRIKYYKNYTCNGQRKLYNSLKKYGWGAHMLEILEECAIENLYARERYYGELFDVLGSNGLNLILPKNGENKKGVSDETRLRMRLSKVGDKNSFYGKSPSLEVREILRKAQTGRKHTMEHRRKVSENNARNNAKLVIDIETGIFYDSIKDAAIAHGQVHSSLKSKVNGGSPTYTPIKVA